MLHNLTMNTLVIAYTITAFICFESAITIFRLNRSAIINRRYAALAFTFTLYSIIMIQFLISPDETACWFWYRMFTVAACLFSILCVLYCLELTGLHSITGKPVFVNMLYALSLFFAIPVITFNPVIYGFSKMPWGWNIVMKSTLWAYCFNTFLICCYIVCALLAIRWRYRALTLREKKQANVIILSGMAGVLGLIHLFISSLHSGHVQVERIHYYNMLCLLLFISGIRYASIKFRLMVLVPASSASELFEGMKDLIFITDTEGVIKFTNKGGGKSAIHSSTGGQRTVYSLFSSGESLRLQVDNLIAGRVINQPVTLSHSGHIHGSAASDIYLHDIRNETGEIIGFMIIAKENRGLADIQRKYRLTKRELEVFLLLNDGLSVQEISSECEISLHTAKTHIHNIYSKTGLRNRVELSNLLNKNN